MLDKVDAVVGNVNVSIDDIDIIFVDIYVYLEGTNSFVEDRIGDHLLLLQSN